MGRKSEQRLDLAITANDGKHYHVGTVTMGPKGDVYFIHRTGRMNSHTSHHASGQVHWKSNNRSEAKRVIRQDPPTRDLKGTRFSTTTGFTLKDLRSLHAEYDKKTGTGYVLLFDLSKCRDDGQVNITYALLTHEASEKFKDMAGDAEAQLFSAPNDMFIGVTVKVF